MLQAIYKKKTKLHERYRRTSEREEGRVAAEDEIASTLFGSIQFMSPESSLEIWRGLLARAEREDFLPAGSPVDASFDFWPSFRDSKGRRVEPDALARYRWADGASRIILLELKWGSGLSGEFQLQRQWSTCIQESERSCSLHLFVGHDLSECVAARMQQDVWRDGSTSRLAMLRWVDVRTALGRFVSRQTTPAAWAIMADTFLSVLNVERFCGFEWVSAEVPLRGFPEIDSGERGAGMAPVGFSQCQDGKFFGSFFTGEEGLMDKVRGALSIGEVLDLADRLGASIDSLLESLVDGFSRELDARGTGINCTVKMKGRQAKFISHQHSPHQWTYRNCSASIGLGRRDGRSKTKAHLSFQASLLGDTLPQGSTDPLMHVHLWEYAIDFNEAEPWYFRFDAKDNWRPDQFGKLLSWAPEWTEGNEPWSMRAWTYSVRLLALNSEGDIRRLVLDPIMALLSGQDVDDALPDALIESGLFLHSEELFRNPGEWCEN